MPNLLLHHDGEFSTHEGLVVATLLGRNMGWLSDEGDRALSHVAAVIRAPSSDDQLSYSQLLSGQPVNGQAIPKRYRLDVATAADHAIIARIADVITVYMRDQRSRRISPYDRFLATNGLPDAPNSEETDAEYTLRLKAAVDALAAPKLVDDGEMKNHQGQRDVFGATELHGLKVFLGTNPTGMSQGQCATCHTPPLFTDFGFHNIGISQIEYEDIHGNGRFFTLQIPSYEDQQKQSDQYLPANAAHPNRPGPYFRVPQKDQPKWADLGVWNVVHNPAIKQETRDRIISAIVRHNPEATTPAAQLKASVAAFRTPMLRNLGHSDPYMHHGGFNALEDVIGHYRSISQLSRIHAVQNPDRALRNIRLTDRDVIALAAFLKSLNEDSGS
ncbi:MAG: cytochrome c peroxidase [Myxococcota bacterium]